VKEGAAGHAGRSALFDHVDIAGGVNPLFPAPALDWAVAQSNAPLATHTLTTPK